MSANRVKKAGGQQTLRAVLQRVHIRVAMIAVLLAGLSVFVVGLATLRVYMIDNLGLSARAIAYTVEAALVFDDRDAAGESLALMAADNPIAAAQVLDLAGNEFAGWKKSASTPYTALEDALATGEVFLKLVKLLEDMGIVTVRQALEASEKTYFARVKY